MTAPIIGHMSRVSLPREFVESYGPITAGVKNRRNLKKRIPGQLWERLRWRDYVENGEPRPFIEERFAVVSWGNPTLRRILVSRSLDARRAEMRERRANKPCKSCDGRGWDFEVMPETDRPDDRVVCPDCWGTGKYVGSISEHADNGGEL